MSLVRVYINKKIKKGFLDLDKSQTHYLSNVMRLRSEDSLNIFNENDGEWEASVSKVKKDSFTIKVKNFIGSQPEPADIWVLFAPVKSLRVDFISQKITELGARLIWPILTERTQIRKIKSSRIIANAIEAAEQCGSTHIPMVNEVEKLEHVIENWLDLSEDRILIFCDENSTIKFSEALDKIKESNKNDKWAILVGPEGGFSNSEREKILNLKNSVSLTLGKRILRSDTAIVSALSVFHSFLGDWKE